MQNAKIYYWSRDLVKNRGMANCYKHAPRTVAKVIAKLQQHDNAIHEHGVYMMLSNPYIALVVKRPMEKYVTSMQDS